MSPCSLLDPSLWESPLPCCQDPQAALWREPRGIKLALLLTACNDLKFLLICFLLFKFCCNFRLFFSPPFLPPSLLSLPPSTIRIKLSEMRQIKSLRHLRRCHEKNVASLLQCSLNLVEVLTNFFVCLGCQLLQEGL